MKKSIFKKWWFWVIAVFVFIGVFGAIGSTVPDTQTAPSVTPAKLKAQVEVTKMQNYVFDVPALMGKNADEIKAALGNAKGQEPTDEQIKLGAKEWDMTFEKDGKELLVTYRIADRKVVDLFISTDDPSGKTKDKKHLLEIGNLSDSNSRYKVAFVTTLKDSSYFTGVKITPNK